MSVKDVWKKALKAKIWNLVDLFGAERKSEAFELKVEGRENVAVIGLVCIALCSNLNKRRMTTRASPHYHSLQHFN